MADELPAIKWPLKQRCVYWAPIAGQTGNYKLWTYETPIEISCRWDEEEKIMMTVDNKEITSQATIMADRRLLKNGILMNCNLSEVVNLTAPYHASNPQGWRIQKSAETPDVRARKCLYEYFV